MPNTSYSPSRARILATVLAYLAVIASIYGLIFSPYPGYLTTEAAKLWSANVPPTLVPMLVEGYAAFYATPVQGFYTIVFAGFGPQPAAAAAVEMPLLHLALPALLAFLAKGEGNFMSITFPVRLVWMLASPPLLMLGLLLLHPSSGTALLLEHGWVYALATLYGFVAFMVADFTVSPTRYMHIVDDKGIFNLGYPLSLPTQVMLVLLTFLPFVAAVVVGVASAPGLKTLLATFVGSLFAAVFLARKVLVPLAPAN